MKYYKLPALLLVFALLFTLAACEAGVNDPTNGPTQEATATAAVSAPPTAEPSAEPVETPEPVVGDAPDIHLAVLSGPTGIGAAKLLSDADSGTGTLRASYAPKIYTDNSELVAELTQGRIDIATMASNMAVNLYNKTDGDVMIIAGGTLGVLHILEGSGGTEISSIADLAGKTIWAYGQGANPEYILRYLLEQNDLDPDDNVEVKFAADASEIQAGLLNGSIRYAMLPVPAATAAIVQGKGTVRAAIDVTDAWNELQSGSQLIMTAVVARTQFVKEHPELVEAFLADYEESISFVKNNIDAAAELVADLGLVPNAAIAKQAIPQCHLAFLSGYDMVSDMSAYFQTLYAIDKASVGGSLPDDGIWYPLYSAG